MKEIIRIMLLAFQGTKEGGCYILFYFLALGLGLAVAWDRYGKNEMEDNWMVEEAKKKIQLWPFLYGILSLILVAMNPFVIWLLNKKTRMEEQYCKVWGLLLFLFLCAYGIVCFLSILREKKQKYMVIFGFVILIGLAGSSYGLTAQRTGMGDYKEEQELAQYIQSENREAMIVATAPFLEYIGVWEPQMKILYGKDIYTPNMDLGIMDTYPTESVKLYELMKQPDGNMGTISRMAAICGCDVIVTSYFENAPDKAGAYYKEAETENYLVYIR